MSSQDRKPIRQSTGAYAIIKARIDDDDKFLLQWNSKWDAYNLIGGHYEQELDRGDYGNTISREVEEELPGLKKGEDFIVEALSPEFWEADHWSESAKEFTHYRFRVYRLIFLGSIALFESRIQQSGQNRWFTLHELMSGKGSEGQKISGFPLSHFEEVFQMASLPNSPLISWGDALKQYPFSSEVERLIRLLYAPTSAPLGFTSMEVERHLSGSFTGSEIFVLRLYAGRQFLRSDVLKLGKYGNLNREKANYDQFIAPLHRNAFIPIQNICQDPTDSSRGALVYWDAENALGGQGVQTLEEYAIENIRARSIAKLDSILRKVLISLDALHKAHPLSGPVAHAALFPNMSGPVAELSAVHDIKLLEKWSFGDLGVRLKNVLKREVPAGALGGTIHGDLNLRNILVSANGEVAFIDYERVEAGKPVYLDFVKFEVEFLNHVLARHMRREKHRYFLVKDLSEIHLSRFKRQLPYRFEFTSRTPRNGLRLLINFRREALGAGPICCAEYAALLFLTASQSLKHLLPAESRGMTIMTAATSQLHC